MSELSDRELLQDYRLRKSEAAFAALVQRHVKLVYSVALRQVAVPAAESRRGQQRSFRRD